MLFTASSIGVSTLLVASAMAQPVESEKRWDCGPASQWYQPGANCENTLYTSGGGHGGYGCGPASQWYVPGPSCENTLYTSKKEKRADCGPASQWYQPGANCENTLYTSGGGSGGYGCGPASQWYVPGPSCENTLYAKKE